MFYWGTAQAGADGRRPPVSFLHAGEVEMKRPQRQGWIARGLVGVALSLPLIFVCGVAADDVPLDPGQKVMRVEEDWEAVLNEPGSAIDAPQFHTVLSPYSHLDAYYLQVSWNYRDQYDFQAGGMQLTAWWGEFPEGKKSYREDKLSTTAETVTWTQSMQITGTMLTLGIDRGSSTTWGTFGGSELQLSGQVGVANLNSYTTDTSVANSWITYGANRVDLLRITEVRRYDANGNLLSRDTTPKFVYQLSQ